MIPFPPGDRTPSAQALEDRTAELKRLEDEVAAFRYLAVKELMLRGSYRDLLKTLDLVERLEARPRRLARPAGGGGLSGRRV